MNARIVSFIFGVTFIAVGTIGFVPNPLVSSGGFFTVNAMHNLVHIVTGTVFLIGAIRYPHAQASLIKYVGIAYVLVTVLGFVNADGMLLGMIHINTADRWLHLGLAVVILGSGLIFSAKRTSPGLIKS